MLSTSARQPRRRGVILLVVMALLSLFAAVGIAFVIYAESAATGARYNREAYAPTQPDVDPELIMNYFLSRFIYDDDNVYSALRGHSLARSLYGWAGTPSDTPSVGVGRLHSTIGGTLSLTEVLATKDDFNYIQYMQYPDAKPRSPDGRHTAVPYTYADHNNVFLAAVNADGEVLRPSYERPWLTPPKPTDPGYDPTNDPIYNPKRVKYTKLWPHNSYHTTFPPPTAGGHVRNLDFGKGTKVGGAYDNNDSFWMDMGFPVLVAKDGRKYKPMVAVICVDLDGKVNINAAGNIRWDATGNVIIDATTTMPLHGSNRGIGPWEINPSQVLSKADWVQLLTHGSLGRYGNANRKPAGGGTLSGPPGGIYAESPPAALTPTPTAPDTLPPPLYARNDIDGWDNAALTLTTLMGLPTGFASFPSYPGGYEDGNPTERTDHAALYNPITPTSPDRRFHVSQAEAALRYGHTGSLSLLSDIFQVSKDSLNPATSKRTRMLITPDSWDFGRPGSSPWLSGDPRYGFGLGQIFPRGTDAVGFGGAGAGGEYAADGNGATRAVQASKRLVQRLLINRRTAAAPVDPALDLTAALQDYPAPETPMNGGRITDLATFGAAQTSRQNLAKDIFELLLWVTMGTAPPAIALAPGDPNEPTHEWLAQLAVNIVDYRDNDDYMTPFKCPTTGKWFFGTELPKLVINEVYSEIRNDPATPATATMTTLPYQVNFWVELLNTMPADANRNNTVQLQMPAFMGELRYAIYKLTICELPDPGDDLFQDKATGAPDPMKIALEVAKYDNADPTPKAGVDTDLVLPVGSAYSGPDQDNMGFYLLGPVADLPSDPMNAAMPAAPKATLRVTEYPADTPPNALMHTADLATTALDNLEEHNILLRRLACPHLKSDTNPASATYNPYITVDYVQKVRTVDGVRVTGTAPNPMVVPLEERRSVGRRQPYSAHPSMQAPQRPDRDDTNPGIDALQFQMQHTFFRHNAIEQKDIVPGVRPLPDATLAGQTLQVPFDWLVHLDRYLASPIELLHVNCFKPYELTQYFTIGGTITNATNTAPIVITSGANHGLSSGDAVYVVGVVGNTAPNDKWWVVKVLSDTTFELKGSTGNNPYMSGGRWWSKFAHQSPWLANGGFPNDGKGDSRLYRLFEYLDAGHRATGVSLEGRIPGRMNINTCDLEAFLALCDARVGGSMFTDAQLKTIFANLLKSRTFDGKDRPFRSLATGHFPVGDTQFPDGLGVDDTLLRRLDPNKDVNQRLLEADHGSLGTHPWQRYELLSKIFNNVTTRSNVFAVWVTVGFFEVTDDTVRPVKLGPEIGADQNRHIRHRMFAIIDRSQLTVPSLGGLPGAATAGDPTTLDLVSDANGIVTATLPAPYGTTIRFQPQVGNKLTIRGASPEEITITSVMQIPADPVLMTPAKVSIGFTPLLTHAAGDSVDTLTLSGIVNPDAGGGIYGNPGPQQRFDMRTQTAVVRYFSVIK